MKAILIHGGPGLNSRAEEVLLSENFSQEGFDVIFWNEPREFKSENPYQEILNSIRNLVLAQEEKVILIGHSSGCKNILNILPTVKEKVKGICFLSAALDFNEADDNIINKGLELLQDDEAKLQLQKLKAQLTPDFDDTRSQAVLLGFSSNYFPLNFNSQESFENYFSHLQGEYEFRINDYLAIRKSMPNQITDSDEVFDTPLIALYGKNDPIFDFEYGKSIIEKYFNNSTSLCLENVAHYPHIDATPVFFENLKKLI